MTLVLENFVTYYDSVFQYSRSLLFRNTESLNYNELKVKLLNKYMPFIEYNDKNSKTALEEITNMKQRLSLAISCAPPNNRIIFSLISKLPNKKLNEVRSTLTIYEMYMLICDVNIVDVELIKLIKKVHSYHYHHTIHIFIENKYLQPQGYVKLLGKLKLKQEEALDIDILILYIDEQGETWKNYVKYPKCKGNDFIVFPINLESIK